MALVEKVVNSSNIPQYNGNTFQVFNVIARVLIESTNATAGTYGQSQVNLCWGWKSSNTGSQGGYSSMRGFNTGSARYQVNSGSWTSWFSGYDVTNCYPQVTYIYHKNTGNTSYGTGTSLSTITCNHTSSGSLSVTLESKIVCSHGSTTWMPKDGTYTATATATIDNVRTVSYNKNGGNSTPSAQRTLDGTAITLASAITKAASVSTTDFNITYNANGGNSTPATQTGTKTVTTPQNFNKWCVNSTSGTAYSAGASYTPTGSNVTMYATWSNGTATTTYKQITLASAITRNTSTDATYTISYNLNGGTSTVPSNQTSRKTTTYTFNAWKDNNNVLHNADSTWSPTAANTLTASWNSVVATELITLPAAPTRPGHTFNGWYTATSGGTKRGGAGSAYYPTQSEILYAQWTPINYSVYIDPNGGAYNSTTSTTTLSSKHYGDTISIAEPTRPGYIFLGWVKNGSGTLTNYTNADPIFASSAGGVGVYNNSGNGAVTHSFVTTSASTTIWGSRDIQIVTANNTTSPGLGGFVQNTSSAANKRFIHFFYAKIPSGYSVQHAENATGNGRTITWLTDTAGSGSYKLYAYQHNCGSTGTFSTFGHVYIVSGTKPLTWVLAASVMVDITSGKATTLTLGAGNCRLTAMWAPATYTITLNPNGGTCSTSSVNMTYSSLTTTLPVPVRDGYKFKGWYANCLGSAGTAINFGRDYKNTTQLNIHFATYSTDYSGWGSYRMISCTESGGWNIENRSGYPSFAVYDNTASAYKYCDFSTKWVDLTPGFHQWDIRLISRVVTVYLDGVQSGTITLAGTSVKYHVVNSIFVGAEATASDSSPTSPYLNGYIGNIWIGAAGNTIGTTYTDLGRTRFTAPTHNITLYAMWEPYFNVYIKGQTSGWVPLKDGYNWQN